MYLSKPDHFKIFKGCYPHVLLGPFLNTLTQMIEEPRKKKLCGHQLKKYSLHKNNYNSLLSNI